MTDIVVYISGYLHKPRSVCIFRHLGNTEIQMDCPGKHIFCHTKSNLRDVVLPKESWYRQGYSTYVKSLLVMKTTFQSYGWS